MDDIVVCSFYTADDYYRGCAEKLRANLAESGIAHELAEIVKRDGEDWADICRKKIGFLKDVCDRNPDKKVFWADVDCQILALPDYVAGFTADLIGFQRGFGSPMTIGYADRSRFWEPCFFGINTSPAARKFIADAALSEQTLRIKATDDYFFEEAWRANAAALSFQIIPSGAVLGRQTPDGGVRAFFVFGASGNVAEFKQLVKQHKPLSASRRKGSGVRRRALRMAKSAERWIERRSQPTAARLRRWADAAGVTHVLTRDHRAITSTGFRNRTALGNQIVMAGQRGELERVRELSAALTASGLPSAKEIGVLQAAEAYSAYMRNGADADQALPLMWWARPFPGNFGDWLSPLLLQSVTDRPVRYVAPTAPSLQRHLVMVGSVGRFIKQRSIVVGTGISSTDIELDPRARYLAVRGPLTADVLRRSGGPSVETLGDPAVLLRRIVAVQLGPTNGRLAFVRHFTHANLPVTLPEGMDELSVLVSHPDDIASFVAKLATYDGVVTSAMHVMITCHTYGIPCTLVGFRGFEGTVHGTGMKYRDYSLGVGLERVWEPQVVPLNLTHINWDLRLEAEKVSDQKLDEIEAAVNEAVAEYLADIG